MSKQLISRSDRWSLKRLASSQFTPWDHVRMLTAHLSQGIQRLTTVTENLSSKYDAHAHVLVQAQNLTNDILDTLETSAHSASSIQDALTQHYGGRNWWPYIICPVVALVAGSYGLPPSAFRTESPTPDTGYIREDD